MGDDGCPVDGMISYPVSIQITTSAPTDNIINTILQTTLVVVLVTRHDQIYTTLLKQGNHPGADVHRPGRLTLLVPGRWIPELDEGRDVAEDDFEGGFLGGWAAQFLLQPGYLGVSFLVGVEDNPTGRADRDGKVGGAIFSW